MEDQSVVGEHLQMLLLVRDPVLAAELPDITRVLPWDVMIMDVGQGSPQGRES